MITKNTKNLNATFFDIVEKNEKKGIQNNKYNIDFLSGRFINGSQTEFQNNKD